MQLPSLLSRFPAALIISILLNVILFAVDFSIDPRQETLSPIQRVVVAMLKPAEALTMQFAPGHGGGQILALAVFSVVIYTILAWVSLSFPLWWGHRQ